MTEQVHTNFVSLMMQYVWTQDQVTDMKNKISQDNLYLIVTVCYYCMN